VAKINKGVPVKTAKQSKLTAILLTVCLVFTLVLIAGCGKTAQSSGGKGSSGGNNGGYTQPTPPTEPPVLPTAKLIGIGVTDYRAEYPLGMAFSTGNIIITGIYDTGETAIVNHWAEYDFSNYNKNVIGNYIIRASVIVPNERDIFTTSFTVKVTNKAVVDIELNTNNVKKEYIETNDLSVTGMIITLIYSNGDRETISNADTILSYCSPKSRLPAGTRTITVKIPGIDITRTFDVSVEPERVVKIEVDYDPDTTQFRTTYYQGEKLNLRYGGILCTYNSGRVYGDNPYFGSDRLNADPPHETVLNTLGNQTVTVSLKTDSSVYTTFNITVNPR